MRIVIQRVGHAEVSVVSEEICQIQNGLLILLGVEEGDNEQDIDWLAQKTAHMRIFADENQIMNKSVMEVDGEVLVVSQFTLLASTKRGNRPGYTRAARPENAIKLYELFCDKLSKIINKRVKQGIFGADMKVTLTNDGPVTIFVDSRNKE